MPEDILSTAEKYLFESRLTDADRADAPRVICRLAGQLSVARSGDPVAVEWVQLLKVISDAESLDYGVIADAVLAQFKVVKK